MPSDAAAVRAADWVHSWEGSKSLSAALRAAKEIGCDAAHLQARDGTATAITHEYLPLVGAAREMLDHAGWHGGGLEEAREYYCEFCRAHHEDSNLIEHTETCRMTLWRAALDGVTGEP